MRLYCLLIIFCGFVSQTADAQTQYRLPFPAGVGARCIRTTAHASTTEIERYAIDFVSQASGIKYVTAARGGCVRRVRSNSNVGGCSDSYENNGNYVVVDHGDGTEALYLHLAYNSVTVSESDNVFPGDTLGVMGATGYACGAHLHFQVQSSPSNGCAAHGATWYSQSQQISFCDVASPNNIPLPGTTYTASNCRLSLSSPAPNTQLNYTGIGLSWTAASQSTAYRIQIATNSFFNNPVVNQNVGNNTSFTWTAQPNTTYYWRVKSSLLPDFDASDEVRSFQTWPAPPTLVAPAIGANGIANPVAFDWADVSGANAYRIQVSDNPALLNEGYNGSYLLNYPGATDPLLTQSAYTWNGAQTATTYYWRVRVNTANGTSRFATGQFSTATGIAANAAGSYQLVYWFDGGPQQTATVSGSVDLPLSTSGLPPGPHTAYFYFVKGDGSRSGITASSFVKTSGAAAAFNQRLEYWFDTAFTQRQTIALNGTDIDEQLSTVALPVGPHVVHTRIQLQDGLWSGVTSSAFTKSNTGASNGRREMEYWFDDGFANRQTLTVVDPADVDAALSTTGLTQGSHTLYTRFRVDGEMWSGITAAPFTKTTKQDGITQMEWWFNGDFDNRQTATLTDLENVDESIATNGLPLGVNTLYTRFQQEGGSWSGITATQFLRNEVTAGPVEYQYWFDSLAGIAKTITVNTADTYFNADLLADASFLDTGGHVILSRFRRGGGLWSSLTADSFYKATSAVYCNITNPPTLDSLEATKFLCQQQIIQDPQDGLYNRNKIMRKDLAKITFRGLMGPGEPSTIADYLPSLFGDLQTENSGNSYYFKAAKVLSYLAYGDAIPPFNPSRINFHPNDTIVRGYVLKVLLEAWNIKPDASLPNPGYEDLVNGAEVNGYVLKAAQLGLIRRPDIDGDNFKNFRAYEACTRIEAFLMLYRLLRNATRPEAKDEDFYMPFLRDNIVGNNPSATEGAFSSYGEAPFSMKGVPSIAFSFNYNTSLLELPDEAVRHRNEAGHLLYDQQTMGVGWTHSYNAYILHDKGIDAGTADDRYVIFWPGGSSQVFDPSANRYVTLGVYDALTTNSAFAPSLISIKNKSGAVYRFERLGGATADNLLHLVSVTDRHGNAVSLTYENGYSDTTSITVKRLAKVDDGHNRRFEFVYLPGSNLIDSVRAVAGMLEKRIKLQYNLRRLVRYTNPRGDETAYGYATQPGSEHLITKITLPRGNVITNNYNTNRKLSASRINNSQQTALQAATTYVNGQRQTDSKITTTVDGAAQVQTVRANAFGRPTAMSGPGYSSVMEYAAGGVNVLLPKSIKNLLTGVETTTSFDSVGNLTSLTRKNLANTVNITETYEYNGDNDLTKKVDGNGNVTTFTYANGKLTKVTAPNGVTNIIPNTNGTVQSVTNPSNITTSFAYDAYGNLQQTSLPLGITSSNGYDAFGRRTSATNPISKSVTYTYDEADNLKQEVFDEGGLNIATKYRYDANDNLIEVENAKGNVTYLTYNNNDQLAKEQFGNAAKQYSYADDGRMKTSTSPNGVAFTNVYNNLDQLVSDGYATYSYNADGSVAAISRQGKTVSYGYDALKRISSTTYNDFGGNTVAYTYDNNNNIKSISYRGGAFVVKYNYDGANRLTSVTDAAGVPWATYTYLADGRVDSQANRNGTVVKYFYDAAGRMDSMVAKKGDGSVIAAYGYAMDAAGNHLSERTVQPLTAQMPEFSRVDSFSYSNTNRLLKKNGDAYSYDANGNLVAINKASGLLGYEYDAKNNLLKYTEGSTETSYEYDGLGQRRRRGGTRLVLDGAYNVIAETDLSGNPLYYYIHGLGLVARIKASDNQPYYYHYDYRGSTVAITNATQAITHKYSYGAFGELQQAVEEDYNTYRYVGKYGVGFETRDLTFMRARYYQPSVGRFNSEDPVWSVNLYPYAGNNALINIDPLGMEEFKVITPTYGGQSPYDFINTQKSLEERISLRDKTIEYYKKRAKTERRPIVMAQLRMSILAINVQISSLRQQLKKDIDYYVQFTLNNASASNEDEVPQKMSTQDANHQAELVLSPVKKALSLAFNNVTDVWDQSIEFIGNKILGFANWSTQIAIDAPNYWKQ